MKSIRILLIISFLGVLSSCEKPSELSFFEKEYPVQPPWASASDFEYAVIGAYWLMSGTPSGNQSAFCGQRITLDVASDGVYNSLQFAVNADMTDIYNHNNIVNKSISDGAFIGCYVGLGTTNDAINFLEMYPDNNPFPTDLNKSQLPRQEGELRFCRAYYWWVISNMFIPMYNPGGSNDDKIVPWRDKLPAGYESAVNSELATTQQIYDRMVSDLKRAIKLIPEKFLSSRDHPSFQFGRANKYTAMALLARVYMQMNEFDKAKAYCDTIINYSESTGTYSLSKEPIEAFNKADGTVYAGQETLWYYLQFDGDGIGSWKILTDLERFGRNTSLTDVNPNRVVSCSDSFLESVGWQNPVTKQPTAEALSDKRYVQLYHRYLASTARPAGYPTPNDGIYEPSFTTNRSYVWSNKYFRNTSVGRIKTNIPMVRLPEIYLTRAILRFKSGDLTGATSDVNKVRVRAGIPPLASVTENDIHNERWKEFNFEGDRVFYLRSLHLDIPAGDRTASSEPWDSDIWLWPIYLREAQLNNSLK